MAPLCDLEAGASRISKVLEKKGLLIRRETNGFA